MLASCNRHNHEVPRSPYSSQTLCLNHRMQIKDQAARRLDENKECCVMDRAGGKRQEMSRYIMPRTLVVQVS